MVIIKHMLDIDIDYFHWSIILRDRLNVGHVFLQMTNHMYPAKLFVMALFLFTLRYFSAKIGSSASVN